jgi:rhodanese-related sulfurtransferase
MNVSQALPLVNAGQAVLVDARDPRLFENLHAAGALSLPIAELEGANGGHIITSLPRDRLLLLYCA